MTHHRTPGRRTRRAAAAALGATLTLGGVAQAAPATTSRAPAAPTPAPTPTFAVTRTPCAGTRVPPPPAPPTRRGRAGATASPTPTPTATPSPSYYPAPVVRAGEHPVGGDQLGTSGIVTAVPAGVPQPPQLDATSYVLADQQTGTILAAKAPHAHLYPASTLKTLTALTVMPQLDPKRVVTATASDQAAEGTRVGMVAGNPYPVHQLYGALLMQSANDAAYALARSAPGGVAGTLQRMNATAAGLGARDTVAVDPSGLDAQGQRSSAYDLVVIGRAAMQRKDFRSYVGTREMPFPGAKQPDGTVVTPYAVPNLNHFFMNYPGATGVKTGYTTGAHRTFIGSATRGGRSYVVSFMCSDTADWHHVAAMMDWAFAHGTKVSGVGTLDTTPPATPTGTPSASPSVPPTVTPVPAPTSSSPTAGQTSQPTGVARALQTWWGAGVLAVLVLAAGALLTRRLGRKR
ncbi:D-alanyl-D-alanine carboxypeptidase family protein [Arsenicicoccus bolidensis]|uniref:Peptidase S11 D-alanyl-D-alanine carboxypeptidase A N-terminal domain-containing protein n=2 Tax=Intrasporangiaceae TaxID=85021 RepID=A0ABS9Q5K6_9MICO|nr:hypothetical protein [Arsenicicoccus bolidensis]MCG7323049.1 hypothetical protein [Arsenicicoccus bolidensis]